MHKWIGEEIFTLSGDPAENPCTLPEDQISTKPYNLGKTILFGQNPIISAIFSLQYCNVICWCESFHLHPLCSTSNLIFSNISKTFPRLDFALVDVGIFLMVALWETLSYFLKKLKNIFSDLVSSEYIAIPCLSNELPNHLFQVTQMYFVTVFDNPVPQRPLNIR